MPENPADEFEDSEETETGSVEKSSVSTYKVIGELSQADAAGVLGKNSSGTGKTVGVKGVTETTDSDEAAGVKGSSPKSNVGVLGQTYDDKSNLFDFGGSSAGIYGRSDKPKGNGVVGWSTNRWGIAGVSESNSYGGVVGTHTGNGFGIWSLNGLRVEGRTSISDVGIEAHQETDVGVNGNTTVIYDNEIVDDRDEYDPSTGKFTCAYDGDYHVEAQIDWPSTFPDHEAIFMEIHVNGTPELLNYQETATDTNGPTQAISKTIRDLSAGDTISIVADHGDGSNTHDLWGNPDYAQLQISQIG